MAPSIDSAAMRARGDGKTLAIADPSRRVLARRLRSRPRIAPDRPRVLRRRAPRVSSAGDSSTSLSRVASARRSSGARRATAAVAAAARCGSPSRRASCAARPRSSGASTTASGIINYNSRASRRRARRRLAGWPAPAMWAIAARREASAKLRQNPAEVTFDDRSVHDRARLSVGYAALYAREQDQSGARGEAHPLSDRKSPPRRSLEETARDGGASSARQGPVYRRRGRDDLRLDGDRRISRRPLWAASPAARRPAGARAGAATRAVRRRGLAGRRLAAYLDGLLERTRQARRRAHGKGTRGTTSARSSVYRESARGGARRRLPAAAALRWPTCR